MVDNAEEDSETLMTKADKRVYGLACFVFLVIIIFTFLAVAGVVSVGVQAIVCFGAVASLLLLIIRELRKLKRE